MPEIDIISRYKAGERGFRGAYLISEVRIS